MRGIGDWALLMRNCARPERAAAGGTGKLEVVALLTPTGSLETVCGPTTGINYAGAFRHCPPGVSCGSPGLFVFPDFDHRFPGAGTSGRKVDDASSPNHCPRRLRRRLATGRSCTLPAWPVRVAESRKLRWRPCGWVQDKTPRMTFARTGPVEIPLQERPRHRRFGTLLLSGLSPPGRFPDERLPPDGPGRR